MPDSAPKDSSRKDTIPKEFFFREGSRYSEAELEEAFGGGGLSENLINRLRARKLIRCGNEHFDDEPDDSDAEVDDADSPYGMRFVGVAVCGNHVIYSVPKYEDAPDREKMKSDASARRELTRHLLDVVSAVVKSGELKGTEQSDEGRDEQSDNYLPIAFALISDYYENGLYVNERIETRQNLDGEILWDKTVNELSPVWVDGRRPCYFDVYARKRRVNEEDFFTQLHQCILSEITSKISESGIVEFIDRLGYPLPDVISDNEMLEFGDAELVVTRVNQELAIQFNTRKQEQLKLMRAYVNRRSQLRRSEFGLLGTCSFHTVWEKACKTVFGDQMEQKIVRDLELEIDGYSKEKRLLKDLPLGQYIEKPVWEIPGQDVKDGRAAKEKNTLRPDCLRIKNGTDGYFDIIDAKYYLIRCDDGKLTGNPGVGDVTKQFLYDYEYRPLLRANGIPLNREHIFNGFLVPRVPNKGSNEKQPRATKFGEVKMPRLQCLGAEELPPIQIWKINARWLLDAYNAGNEVLSKQESISNWLK